MTVTIGITSDIGITSTVSASNTKAVGILKRAAAELGLDTGAATNQQIADFIVAEWRGHLMHLAERNKIAEDTGPVVDNVKADPALDWDTN